MYFLICTSSTATDGHLSQASDVSDVLIVLPFVCGIRSFNGICISNMISRRISRQSADTLYIVTQNKLTMTPSEDILQDYTGKPIAIIVVILIFLAIFVIAGIHLFKWIINLIF
jgi:hypothetical protein